MKVGIYTPYLDSFGGGERYMLSIAEILSKDHCVDLFLDKHQLTLQPELLVPKLAKYLDLDLSKINLLPAPIGEGSNFFERFFFLKKYDLVVYLTDGSIFYSTAKKNLLHFQVPFKNSSAHGIWGKIKLSTWNLAICNSLFTEKCIKETWPIKTVLLYPPVETEKIKPLKKEKWILSVGRFTSFSKSKKHEEMINAFRKLYKEEKINDWSLQLAGSVEGDPNYLDGLKELAKGIPVYFYPDLAFDKLVELYGKSSIYWHAAGFNENEPEKMEHFGITTVEAMAAGCIPIVTNKGGQGEVVDNDLNGYIWGDIDELIIQTKKVISSSEISNKLSQNAIIKSKLFSKNLFAEKLNSVIKSI